MNKLLNIIAYTVLGIVGLELVKYVLMGIVCLYRYDSIMTLHLIKLYGIVIVSVWALLRVLGHHGSYHGHKK